MSRERAAYNFPRDSKNKIRYSSRGRDVYDGEIDGSEQIHHLVFCWYAIQENIPRQLIRDPNNGVVLSKVNHNQLHREAQKWSPEWEFTYFTAVLEHIVEARQGKLSKTLLEIRQPLYEIDQEVESF